MEKNFSVWVGGVEINDFYLTEAQAKTLADQFINDGFEDVAIEKVEQ